VKVSTLTTTITITGIDRSLGNVVRSKVVPGGIIQENPEPPSLDISIQVSDGKHEETFHDTLLIDDWQAEWLIGARNRLVRDFQAKHYPQEKQEPIPNYYGHRITRLVTYDKDTPKAVLEIEGHEGQWVVLFNALDHYTQRWILNEWWERLPRWPAS
jgi:hypothetical protein